jgi:hypothetical protein
MRCASCNAPCNDIFLLNDDLYCSKWCRKKGERGIPDPEEDVKFVELKTSRLSFASTAPTEDSRSPTMETDRCGLFPSTALGGPVIRPAESPMPPPMLDLEALAPHALIKDVHETSTDSSARCCCSTPTHFELEPRRLRCGRVNCSFCDRLYD